MITVIDRNILNQLNESGIVLVNTDDIDGLLMGKELISSSPDPNESKLVPTVLYSLYLTFKEIDKVFINSVKISDKDIKFVHTDKNNLVIRNIDFCDDIVIDYDTKQDMREKKLNKFIK
jgi:hypothetical protein